MYSQVEIAVSSMSDQAMPYPYCQSNSGIILKFIPHIPARNVSGMKIVDTIVRRFMIAFMRRSLLGYVEIDQGRYDFPAAFGCLDDELQLVG